MDQSRVTELVLLELGKAVDGPFDTLLIGLSPGIFLLPFPVAIAAAGSGFYDFFAGCVQNIQRVPALVVGRILVETATEADSTKVVTIAQAKKFAADAALSAVYEISGRNPPATFSALHKFQTVKGLRKRLIGREQQQILGKVGSKLFSILRAPLHFVTTALSILWGAIVALMALGCVFSLWTIVAEDWDRIALSQRHKRKRMVGKINRRL